jgi:3-deoxy-D-manno-octulosonic-acid transferase
MLALYYFALLAAGLIVGPWLLWRKKARAGLWQKLGFVPKRFKAQGQIAGATGAPIWVHAVSVGEFNAVWPLLEALHAKHADQRIVVSTTTATGQQLAKERAGSFAEIFYFPFDIPWATAAWLGAIKPQAVLVVETEVWPGFYWQCAARKIPLIVVNGRISPRSYKKYSQLKWLFRGVFQCASLILAQSQEEETRYRDITDGAVAIEVTGNLKFDGLSQISVEEQRQLRHKLGLQGDELVIVAGSTHEGEEAAMLRALTELTDSGNSKVRLVLVPRHPERFDRVADMIGAHGFRARRFSKEEAFAKRNDVFLLDAIGHLTRFYSAADIAFVGGTLVKIGGHNLVEPCIYSVPVVCGPHVEKTRDVARALTAENAIMLAESEDNLLKSIKKLAADPQLRQEIGDNGKRWLAGSQGAVSRALKSLEQHKGLLSGSAKLAESQRDLSPASRCGGRQ